MSRAQVKVRTWCSKFRNEIGWTPDSLLRTRYPLLVRSMAHDFGGHFAAFEVPEALADDIWSAFTEDDRNEFPKNCICI